jgi:hypothetical protein
MPKVNRKTRAKEEEVKQEQDSEGGVATQDAPEAPEQEQQEEPAPEKKAKKGKRGKATDPVKESSEERPVLYPDYTAAFYAKGYQEPAEIGVHEGEMTAARMKDLLGWTEVGKDADSYDLVDAFGTRIVLKNNYGNRPLRKGLANDWKLEILKRHWKLNGESFIVGRHGMIISGQHRGVGLVLAAQEWSKPSNFSWHSVWGTPGKNGTEPTIPLLVVYGISEDDGTVNTVDTGAPRKGSDAIFRSDLFRNYGVKDRRFLSRSMEFAVRTVWDRTGQEDSAYTPHMQHTDMFDFVDSHKRLRDAVEFIWKTNNDGSSNSPARGYIARHIGQGVAAGLMFLMGASKSDYSKYHTKRKTREASQRYCDFTHWDRARAFWAEFAAASKQFRGDAPKISPLLPLMRAMEAERVDGRPADLDKRIILIIKAWRSWLTREGEMTERDLQIAYKVHSTGVRYVDPDHYPEIGGIDTAPKDHLVSLVKRLDAQVTAGSNGETDGSEPGEEEEDKAFDMPDDAPREDTDEDELE